MPQNPLNPVPGMKVAPLPPIGPGFAPAPSICGGLVPLPGLGGGFGVGSGLVPPHSPSGGRR